MNASNLLCKELMPTYTNIKPLGKDEFIGYKLAEKKALNYYSIVTGMFRYKARNVSECTYSELYRRDSKEFYIEEMANSLAVFTTPENAKLALEKYVEINDRKCELVVLRITLKKNLRSGTYSNKFVSNLPIVIGEMMDRIVELK